MILLSLEERYNYDLDSQLMAPPRKHVSIVVPNINLMLFPSHMSDEKVIELVQGFKSGDDDLEPVLTANCKADFYPIFDRVGNSVVVASKEKPDGSSYIKIMLAHSMRTSAFFYNAKSSQYVENTNDFKFRIKCKSLEARFDLHNLCMPFSFDWHTQELLLKDEADYVQYIMITS